MSGLLALLDDVAAIAKVAAANLDDIASQATKTTAKVAGTVIDDAAKAGAKAAGAVIDDAAVTPKYVHGFSPAREIPIVWKIARGSFFNKLIILLPIALALSAFAPWAIAPLLMLGGAYLCFEGAEKVLHALGWGHHEAHHDDGGDPAHLEESRVKGAIKTDFILSAEIMTIALAAIPDRGFWVEAATLAVVGIAITVAVYGSVALIVKADDIGLAMARSGRLGATRAMGRGIVKGMPGFMKALTIIGTAAMVWVGGSIIVHGLEVLGFAALGHTIHDIAVAAGTALPSIAGAAEWITTAFLDGIVGLIVGFAVIPVTRYILAPLAGMFKRAS